MSRGLFVSFVKDIKLFSPISWAGVRFSARKRNVPCTVQRKRGLAAALRRLGLLLIDRHLITERSAIWSTFRMRFRISAAAANGCGKYCIRPLRCQRIEAQLFPAAASFGRSPQEKQCFTKRRSAPVGGAGQHEGEKPSFSSTPAGRSSFSFAERKRRGGCKIAPAHGVGKRAPCAAREKTASPAQHEKALPLCNGQQQYYLARG